MSSIFQHTAGGACSHPRETPVSQRAWKCIKRNKLPRHEWKPGSKSGWSAGGWPAKADGQLDPSKREMTFVPATYKLMFIFVSQNQLCFDLIVGCFQWKGQKCLQKEKEMAIKNVSFHLSVPQELTHISWLFLGACWSQFCLPRAHNYSNIWTERQEGKKKKKKKKQTVLLAYTLNFGQEQLCFTYTCC